MELVARLDYVATGRERDLLAIRAEADLTRHDIGDFVLQRVRVRRDEGSRREDVLDDRERTGLGGGQSRRRRQTGDERSIWAVRLD